MQRISALFASKNPPATSHPKIFSPVPLPETAGKAGVFANQSPEEIAAIAKTSGLTTIQLHSDESPEFCQKVRKLLPDLELIKALRVRNRRTLEAAKNYEFVVDALLLDAYHPEQLGGTGHTIDWADLQAFKPSIPWLLAGGLKPENIQQALTQLRPNGIDLSSGVEDSPGQKNLDKVAELMTQLAALNMISK